MSMIIMQIKVIKLAYMLPKDLMLYKTHEQKYLYFDKPYLDRFFEINQYLCKILIFKKVAPISIIFNNINSKN